MADIENQTPVEGTPAEDIEMNEGAEAGAAEETNLTELEPETPKLVLFAEYVLESEGNRLHTSGCHATVVARQLGCATSAVQARTSKGKRENIY